MLGRIDRMRDAPLTERAAHIRKLATLAPTDAKAATARRACLDAYQKLQRAHDEMGQATARIKRMAESGRKPRYEEVVAADRATAMMGDAEKAEPACARAVANLRRALR